MVLAVLPGNCLNGDLVAYFALQPGEDLLRAGWT